MCILLQRQLVRAATRRTGDHLEHAGGRKLQRLLLAVALQNPSQKQSCHQIACSVGRIVDQPVLGKQRVMPGEIEVARASIHHRDRRCHQHPRWPKRQSRFENGRIAVESGARKPGQLEPVRRGQPRERNQAIPNARGHRFRHVEIAPVADHRIAGIEEVRVARLQRLHQPRDRLDLLRIAEIPGQHGADLADPGRRRKLAQHGIERLGIDRHPRRAAMAGMPGHDDGRHGPDGEAQCFQRKHGCPIADGAAHDVAGNDDDGAGSGLGHAAGLSLGRAPDRSPNGHTAVNCAWEGREGGNHVTRNTGTKAHRRFGRNWQACGRKCEFFC